ncbi:MAG: hypothetical protein ABIP56_04165 [Dokdonella sp.]
MKLLRVIPVFVLYLFIGAAAIAQDTGAPPATVSFDATPLITDGLLDSSRPIEHRRELAKRLIEAADLEKTPVLLYYVGSLYRQGDSAGIAPFPQDLNRAREYLTRAALGGYIDAMSKMAVVELDSGNRFEANLWAQLYAHYSSIKNPEKPADTHAYRNPSGHESLASALLALTMDGFPESEVPRLIERANAMVARYDAPILAEMGRIKAEYEQAALPKLTRGGGKEMSPLQLRNELGRKAASAQGEYFFEFSPDGKLLRFWPFDGFPGQKVLRVLRPMASGMRFWPAPGSTIEKRVFLIPIIFANAAYRLEQEDEKK